MISTLGAISLVAARRRMLAGSAGSSILAGVFFSSTPNKSLPTIVKSDAEWKESLPSPLSFEVLRRKGTERAFTGEFWDSKEKGIYLCGGCSQPLFRYVSFMAYLLEFNHLTSLDDVRRRD